MPMKRGRGEPGARFAEAAKRVELAVEAAGKEAALILQQEVVARAPVKTGNLRDTFASAEAIAPLRKPGLYRFGLITPALRKRAFYAKYVEFGTKGNLGAKPKKGAKRKIGPHPAHPFFRPGVEAARARIKALIVNAAQNALKE